MNLRTMATFREVNGVAAPLVYGVTPGSSTTWDADKIMGCLCDQGRYNRNQYSWTGVREHLPVVLLIVFVLSSFCCFIFIVN